MISPGIPHRWPTPHPAAARAEAEGVEIISDIELMMRADIKARVIGITGTNGKSTTALLLGHILNAAGITAHVGGNIGTAVLAMDDPGPDGVLVLELSSYQLETTPGLRLDAGAVTNITPDHLDRHDGWEGYVAAKAMLARAVKAEGLLVLGRDKSLDAMAAASTATAERIGPDDAPLIISSPGLAGPHNIENTAVAFKLANAMGGNKDVMAASLESLPVCRTAWSRSPVQTGYISSMTARRPMPQPHDRPCAASRRSIGLPVVKPRMAVSERWSMISAM